MTEQQYYERLKNRDFRECVKIHQRMGDNIEAHKDYWDGPHLRWMKSEFQKMANAIKRIQFERRII